MLRESLVRVCALPNRWGVVGNRAYLITEPVVQRLCGGRSTVVMRRFKEGFTMRLDAGQKTSRQLLLLPQYEMWIAKFVRENLKPGEFFVDIGAHQGYFSLLAATLVGELGRVLAFEAAADNAAKLRENVAHSGFTHIESVNLALGEQQGEAVLSRNPMNEGGHSLLLRPGMPTERVKVSTLDAELAARGLPPPQMLKIDAEGYELPILQGARQTLASTDRMAVIVELSHERAAIAAYLRERGFAGRFFGRRGLVLLPENPPKGNALFTRGYATTGL